jgi:hypothetical protein
MGGRAREVERGSTDGTVGDSSITTVDDPVVDDGGKGSNAAFKSGATVEFDDDDLVIAIGDEAAGFTDD